MQSADYPDLPYVAARGDGGTRTATKWIIIHATDNTAPAKNEAAYASRREDETSAHYYIDDTQVIQALPINHIAWGALYNGNQSSVQYELCGRSNQISDATMARAAKQVARDCTRYGLPIRKLTPQQIAAGEKGICGHGDITVAFPGDGGDHTDPGASFPWPRFIALVQQAANPTPPTPTKRTITLAAWPGKPSSMWQVAEAAYGVGQGKRWDQIWNAPENAGLRTRAGGDPQRVQPGWIVVIP